MKNALEKLDDTEISGKRIVMIEDKPRGSSRRRYVLCIGHKKNYLSLSTN